MQSLWMIVASLLFACMGVCVKLGSTQFSAGEMVSWRGLVGVLMVGVLARAQGVRLATPLWRLQLSRGLSGSFALMCYFVAIGLLPLATAVTLSYTSPIFVALLLALMFGERLRPGVLLAVGTGFVGIVLLLRPTLQADQWLGALVGLGAGLVSSLAYVSVRELGRAGEPEVRTVFWFSALTALLGLPWLVAGGNLATLDLRGVLVIAGIGLFGGGAQLAMTRAYRLGKTIVSASLAYTTVIFSSLFGMLLWDETLPPAALLAIALIVASGVMTSLATRSPARRPGPPIERPGGEGYSSPHDPPAFRRLP
ncbi:DMT family transporter [Pseudothauera rhizosphaerae]|uniref:DMT family transporter n=1 Tax=Pseudothauera rhizosphaerae TaxID=2565932 RepID=A0A4S4AN39_9RHOO|nr:DMT family transporter [Pseudothauera rhizosphaerae]THF60612.1 DMT family transporter [Pseudothauera rhizosphaerae]